MIHYTDRLTSLMVDITRRVPALSFIDMSEVLVFARLGRLNRAGSLATCHCLTLPATEPGYYFWSDRATGQVTRRSVSFVTKSPAVTIQGRPQKYLISFSLPRFCDQSLARSHKARFYRRADDAWVAKLDTVIHELYHIDPEQNGIRRIHRGDGTYFAACHGGRFFEEVADMVGTYLADHPNPAIYEFLRHPFHVLDAQYGGVVGTSFRPFPTYPQRYAEPLAAEKPDPGGPPDVPVEALRPSRQKASFTERDLELRRFLPDRSRAIAVGTPLITGDVTPLSAGVDVARSAGAPSRRAGDRTPASPS